LQTTPLIIFFQHSNLKATEWVSIRRELASALRKLDAQLAAQGKPREDLIGEFVKLQVIKTNMFEPALRIAEYFKPGSPDAQAQAQAHQEGGGGGASPVSVSSEKEDPSLTHALSVAAYHASQAHRNEHVLTPLLAGNVAILTFPTVSPVYVKTAFSILAPQPGVFAAPTRRANPLYHEPAVQDGLKKLMLLGARIDGQVFDMEGTRWVGGIEGGIDGLRAQLVGMLQGFGAGVVQVLESGSRAVWWTMEGRRKMLEEESPKEEVQRQE
jgi:ribosomal protein L10